MGNRKIKQLHLPLGQIIVTLTIASPNPTTYTFTGQTLLVCLPIIDPDLKCVMNTTQRASMNMSLLVKILHNNWYEIGPTPTYNQTIYIKYSS